MEGAPIQDKRINCLKRAHLTLNSFWLLALYLHFFLLVRSTPCSSSYWPFELLLLVTALLHFLNILIVRRVGISHLYSSFGCLALEGFCLFLLLAAAFLILKFLMPLKISSLLIEYLLCFFQSLVFFKCIYLRVKYVRSQTHYSLYETMLDRFKVSSVPEHHSNTVCSICLEEMNDSSDINANLIALPCGNKVKHCFHFTCFQKWFERSTHCPLCRSKEYLKTLMSTHRSASSSLRRITSLTASRNPRIIPAQLPSGVQI